MTCVKRDREGPKGQPEGTYATDPAEVDEIIRKAWGGIFRGNCDNPHKQAALFMQQYKEHVYGGEEQTDPPLTAAHMRE